MVRFSSIVTVGVLVLVPLLGCGDKQNPAGNYQPPAGSGGSSGFDALGTGGNGGVSYVQTIAPMMAASCAVSGCHDSATRTAGIALDRYEDVQANAEAANAVIQNKSMPIGSVPPLSEADRQSFDSWVTAGAPNN